MSMTMTNASMRPSARVVDPTVVFFKRRDTVIKGHFSEVVRGEFPLTHYEAVPLQLPPGGSTSNMMQRFLRHPSVTEDGGFVDIIHLPLYSAESLSDTRALEDSSKSRRPTRSGETAVIAKTPLLVIATRGCTSMDDGRYSQVVNVLPIWSDGTAVLLELDWCEGNPCEDCINPEWHLRASTGLLLDQGLAQFVDCSKMFPGWEKCRFHMYVIPSLLGGQILPDRREQGPSPLWPHQWTFATCDELRSAVHRFADEMAHLTICT